MTCFYKVNVVFTYKKRMKVCLYSLFLMLVSSGLAGQNCNLLSKANNIVPDKFCSPVTANWQVSYTGVNNAGTPVSIRYDWGNGRVVTVPAINVGPGIFEATATNTYTSAGDICNYHPQSTLIVNGVVCSSSTQEQIVTVWDNDDHNGGHMHINPVVYPVCLGNSADARFQDLTQFNCVPPQERDNPNVNTRWVQWIYGTDITMTGIPVTINGTARTYPYRGSIITLNGPVTGSGVWSDIINVANDKLLGQHFQVTLRNWNYCNPYDDPNIPGPPSDPVNGDHPPVVTTAIILIVPYPDATITPVDSMCLNNGHVNLTAHDPGGTWSGDGVRGHTFDPAMAGVGNHIIRYSVSNQYNCTDVDQITVTVMPVPDATITPVAILCSSDPPTTLRAHDPGGTWSGTGVTGNTFDPSVPGPGNYTITYSITDKFGCSDSDQTVITVATPDATITPVDTLCVNGPGITLTAHDLGGLWSGAGVSGDTFFPEIAGTGDHVISYNIVNQNCTDFDTTVITVVPAPVATLEQPGILFLTDPPVTLIATPVGGTFSGNGVTGNIFSPARAGLGTHVIQYQTLPDHFGCIGTDTIQITVTSLPVPSAEFEPDTSGCTPLNVRFRNLSTYGESYLWDFGDNTFSHDRDPSHTYFTPGEYIVRLTVTNKTGEASFVGSIKVFQNPTTIFNIYPTDVINNSQVVRFYNYSYYGVSFLWDFGDGNTSTDENPWHKYEKSGVYRVSLTVTSKDGCVDSLLANSGVNVDFKFGDIRYPNAFRWNGSGPTGGYWDENQMDDRVFRPFYTNIREYKLQIFNRWGVLIYESSDLHKGWDGYFGKSNLALQGVYVWKATGQYEDGTYFNKVGDVTFLH